MRIEGECEGRDEGEGENENEDEGEGEGVLIAGGHRLCGPLQALQTTSTDLSVPVRAHVVMVEQPAVGERQHFGDSVGGHAV